jgi:hypothetical protein
MTISYVIECGWQKGRYYAGLDTGTAIRWVSDINHAVRFPGSYEASQYAHTALHIDKFEVQSVAGEEAT